MLKIFVYNTRVKTIFDSNILLKGGKYFKRAIFFTEKVSISGVKNFKSLYKIRSKKCTPIFAHNLQS